MKSITALSFALGLAQAGAGPTQFVNQFIGTTNGGHVFPGATLPWGSVKAVADCDSGENQGGFVSDGSRIRGLSPLHDDGTGGGPSLGEFKILPMFCEGGPAGCDGREGNRAVDRVEGSAKATPGYFTINLASNTQAEVTVTDHVALYRLTFSNFSADATAKPVILFDLTNDLSHSFQGGEQTIAFSGNNQLRVTGFGTFGPSFGEGNYRAFFCMDIPNVSSAAFWVNGQVTPVTTNTTTSFPSGEAGAIAQISDAALASSGNSAIVRTGVSWTSVEKACAFAASEIPKVDDAQFETTREAAQAKWDNTLGTVQIDTTGASDEHVVLFWSSLYRSYISPTNITGDNPLYESSEPYYDSLYCIWDSFRVVHPLYAITQRETQAEVVRALIDIERHLGFLPDCRMSLDKGLTQGGSNADSLLSDSYVKGIRNGVNWNDGLKAMIKDAEVTPPDWTVEGRGGIVNRKKLGYVPLDDDTPGGIRGRSASRTLEYAVNDFGIALVANGQGQRAQARHYTDVSGDWKNLWNANVSDSGFTGFIQPRFVNGSFSFVDPRFCSPVLGHTSCFLNDQGGEFYEASSWEYSFYVPQDMASVVKLMGGPETYVKRLDALFELGFHDIGDEPGFLHCFLYNYAGRPDKTADRVLSVLAANYSTAIGGLPGNDDSGAMGGFAVFSSFGFYPIAGTSVYVISTPLFREITFPSSLPGRRAMIKTVGFDGATRNKYVQSAKLNGRPFTRNWFRHDEFFGVGATLELELGPRPSKWGTRQEDLPPSISTSKSLTPFS
ncbi:alpha-1,2-mannosidase, putative subfamily [Auricularia subglabra TFB-10046 SS5]|nr:alpha-1,2-mannosidase, putative subfamily [Auricularia subglabra TFB-10046 SS5]